MAKDFPPQEPTGSEYASEYFQYSGNLHGHYHLLQHDDNSSFRQHWERGGKRSNNESGSITCLLGLPSLSRPLIPVYFLPPSAATMAAGVLRPAVECAGGRMSIPSTVCRPTGIVFVLLLVLRALLPGAGSNPCVSAGSLAFSAFARAHWESSVPRNSLPSHHFLLPFSNVLITILFLPVFLRPSTNLPPRSARAEGNYSTRRSPYVYLFACTFPLRVSSLPSVRPSGYSQPA